MNLKLRIGWVWIGVGCACVALLFFVIPGFRVSSTEHDQRPESAEENPNPASSPPAVSHQTSHTAASKAQRPNRIVPPSSPAPASIRAAANPKPTPYRPLLADPDVRARRVARLNRQHQEAQERAQAWARRTGEPMRFVTNGTVVLLVDYREDMGPLYKATFNANAAISTAADVLHDAPYALTGANVLAGIWDGGNVRATHVELSGRVTNFDSVGNDDHATHVSGTMLASGVNASAKGMAPSALLHAYDFNNDLAEMTTRAMADPSETNQIQISNHSYGFLSGYATQFNPRRWYGTWFQGYRESDYFGVYSSIERDYDALCYDAPYYLPFKAAGNDRNDAAPSSGANFQYWNGTNWVTKAYDTAADPFSDFHKQGGYDTIALSSAPKNMMIIGAVNDAVTSGERDITKATMASFSSWGPTDDGRIKPDLVANGVSLFSSGSANNTSYNTKQGTSMATPNASGSALLLVELYKQRFSNALMRASTIKALMIHTADDVHNAGPDYRTGWGLVNVETAAQHIERHHAFPSAGAMVEDILTDETPERVYNIHWDNNAPLRATLAWTDPPGPELWGLNLTNLALINDLDMRIVDPSGQTNFPWVLQPTNYNALATTGDNFRDNVEQIVLTTPPTNGVYQIRITHKNSLANGFQHFSLMISGTAVPVDITHEPLINTTNDTVPYVISASFTPTQVVDVASLELLWNTDGDPDVFATNTFTWIEEAAYESEIPAHPIGTDLYYFIRATSTNGITTTHPPDAPGSLNQFSIQPPALLTVTGTPVQAGVVLPAYGDTIFAIGNRVDAEAPVFSDPIGGERYRNTGWIGTSDVSPPGVTNSLSFVITTNTTLDWQWTRQLNVTETSSVPGLLFIETWLDEHATTTPHHAATTIEQDDVTYRFAAWQRDGIRQTNAFGVSLNPVQPFPLTSPTTLLAVYFDENQDTDGQGLPDWWQVYHFGALGQDPDNDADNDGFGLLSEYRDGTDPLDENSVPEPPDITHTPLADPQEHPAPFLITAEITDNFSIASASLWWNINNEGWNDVPLHHAGDNTFTNAIPAPIEANQQVSYYITAEDAAGLSTTHGPHEFDVAYPILQAHPTNAIAYVLQPGENESFWIAITNAGNWPLDWDLSILPAGFFDDTESGTNGWSRSGTNTFWHLSTNRVWSGTHAWYNGIPGTSGYMEEMYAMLDTPPVYVFDQNPTLTFRHWIEAEINDSASAWHGGLVQVSTNNGATFEQITPEGGYPYVIAWWSYAPFPFLTPIYAGTGGWQQATFDLAAYAGETITLRFIFGSDTVYVGHEGWYIDDITLAPRSGTNNWITASPTQGSVWALHSTTQILVSVTTDDVTTGVDLAASIQIESNDPLMPVYTLPVLAQVRTPPTLDILSAAQTSTNGEGHVTMEADLFNPDPEAMAMVIETSTNNALSWTDAWILSAQANGSEPTVTNPGTPQVSGIASGDSISPFTNRAVTVWSSTNTPPISLSSSTVMRARVWDGFFWSDYATSSVFLVDNEAPGAPGGLTSPSHTIGQWSTVNIMDAEWTAASDGDGIGVARYAVRAGPGQIAPSISNIVADTETIFTNVMDSSNIWLGVRAIDAMGNAGAASLLGPFMIDVTPPDASTATVQIFSSRYGPYTLSPMLTNMWGGFADATSGLEGYYYHSVDGSGSTNGFWTTSLSGVLVVTNLNATNTVYVWARDEAGNIGVSVSASTLVLTENGDWDGDSVSNADEEIAGTSASDDTSLFASERVVDEDAPGNILVRWPWAEDRAYVILWADSLEEPVVWNEITDPAYTEEDGWAIWTDPNPLTTPDGKRYYRIIARLVAE